MSKRLSKAEWDRFLKAGGNTARVTGSVTLKPKPVLPHLRYQQKKKVRVGAKARLASEVRR